MATTPDYRALFGFTAPWFALGIVTDADVARIGADYEASDDKSLEHYRYRAYRSWRDTHRPLAETTLVALYELGEVDPDFGGAILADIVGLPECPPSLLARAAASGQKHLVTLVERRRLLALLDKAELTADDFDALLHGDAVVQRALLARRSLTTAQWEALAERGATRGVRNVAGDQLRRRARRAK